MGPRGERILVVDDETPMRVLLRQYLTREGYQVLEAADGTRALDAARSQAPDLVLLDLMLPEVDGFELLRQIRQTSDVPIIMLTARGEETHRVAGLELGADDYVLKPFFPAEVVARVRARLRRRPVTEAKAEATELSVGALQLDATARDCTVDGRPVQLTRREFDLLAVLASQPGRVFTREQLLDAAWGSSQYVCAKTVDVHVCCLRRKLTDRVPIEALRGVGYRLSR